MVMKRLSSPTPSTLAALAVLIAAGAVVPAVRAQNTAAPKANPMATLIGEAEQLFQSRQYDKAAEKYKQVLEKYGTSLEDKAKAALVFRTASCAFLSKNWAEAEKSLNDFLQNYPRGTEDFLDPNNNYRAQAQLSLAETQANLGKYDEAIAGLRAFALSFDNTPQDKTRALMFMAALIEKKAEKGTPEEKKAATKRAIEIVRPITQNNISLPEVREAAYRLVTLYTNAGMVREATQLRKELEARITNPADLVRANFLKLDLGDRYYRQAEELQGTGEDDRRNALYKQALEAYQGVYRRKYIGTFMDKAVAQAQARVDDMNKRYPLAESAKEDDPRRAPVKEAENELGAIKKIAEDFEKNKDYDSMLAFRLGICLTELKRPWEARVAFKQIIDNNPEFEKADIAHYWYIMALRDIRRNKDAQEECRKFLQKYPASGQLGSVAVMLGDISAQEEEYRKAVENYRWARLNVKGLTAADCEYIDGAIADAFFRNLDWNESRRAIENFIANYPKSNALETMSYMRALTYFYEGKYKETRASFDEYNKSYPKGLYKPDIAYRYALVILGLKEDNDEGRLRANALDVVRRCDDWLKDYAESGDPQIANQRPEIVNLKGDAYTKIADFRSASPEDKKKYASLAIDCYVEAAKTAGTNKQVLDFALRELNKTLPARGEWDRLRDIYDALYKRDPKSPEALGYLYQKIRCTEKMGKTPEERQKNAEEAKTILANAIVENINDVRQDNVEQLIIALADKLARKSRQHDKLVKDKKAPEGAAYDAGKELETLLKLQENRDSLIAQARGYFARSEIAKALRRNDEAARQLDAIARNFKPDELSPTILAIVGEHEFTAGRIPNAETFFTYLKDSYRGSQFADFGFAGLATIRLNQGKAKEALALCRDSLENGIYMSKEKDIRFLEARALMETGAMEEAKKSFTALAGIKEYRGEVTAGCLYYLGFIEERAGKFAEAKNYYQRCFLSWKKYEKYAMKAIYRTALVLADHLNNVKGARETLDQQLFKNTDTRTVERFKTTPEWAEAEKLADRLK